MILIDPLCDINYSSFYIYGLRRLIGRRNMRFSSMPFTEIYKAGAGGTGLYLYDTKTRKKYVIDFRDQNDIDEIAYEWCDVYGCVNICADKLGEEQRKKLVVLGPNFGVKLWCKPIGYLYAIANAVKGRPSNLRKFIGKYKHMLERMTLESYCRKVQTNEHYVFHISTLWYSDEWVNNDDGCNLARANFIRACKSNPDIIFKGGLVVPGNPKYPVHPEKFTDVLTGPVNMKEWLNETLKSLFVFNTPAWDNCNGWKLGEYLAMGKPIISTEIKNDLPAPIRNGVEAIFVNNTVEDISATISELMMNTQLRQSLSDNAKHYWETYCTPEQSLQLLGICKYE